MLKLIYLISLIYLTKSAKLLHHDKDNYDERNFLLKHFFSNIKEDYKHVLSTKVSDMLRVEVNGKIESFVKNLNVNRDKSIAGIVENVIDIDYGENSGIKTRQKRAISNLIRVDKDAGVFILNGFKVVGSIPVNFPKDICLFNITDKLYAAALTDEPDSNNTKLIFYVQMNGTFTKYKEMETNSAERMDCTTMHDVGYLAIVNPTAEATTIPTEGSKVYQITANDIAVVQVLRSSFLKSIRLWFHANELYLMKTFYGSPEATIQKCPVYRWRGFHFDIIDELPCHNAVQIEPFVIVERSEFFVAIANYQDQTGTTETVSTIYKYDDNKENFNIFQNIRTKGAVDVKFFYFETSAGKTDNFLVFANSLETYSNGTTNPETYSIIYKFVNGNFVPFQRMLFYAVRQFLPVLGRENQFLLIAVCENQAVQVYQYDGWRFILSSSYLTGDVFGKGISSIRSALVNGETMIVIANRMLDGEYPNIFSPIYTHKNDLKQLESGVLEWCQKNLERIKHVDYDGMVSRIERFPKVGDPFVETRGMTELKNSKVNKFTTKYVRTTKQNLNQQYFDSINMIHVDLEELKRKVLNLENPNESIIGAEEPAVITFDEVIVGNSLSTEFLNANPTSSLVHTTDSLNLDLLKVGRLIINSDMKITDQIDGIKFDKNHVLLKSGDQFLNGTLTVLNANIDRLDTIKINQINLHRGPSTTSDLKGAKKIIAKNLIVKGRTNGVDIEPLDRLALKVIGDQALTAGFSINLLRASSINAKGFVSGKNMNQLVLVDEGKSYNINQDIQFANLVEVNNLRVDDRINNLRIFNGKLNVLLKNSADLQTVTGNKVFDKVRLLEPITLSGKIESKSLQQMNPIITIDEDIIVTGDFTITGNVTIQRLLKSLNIVGQSGNHSVKNLLEHGLQLENSPITVPIIFHQPIKVKKLNAKLINQQDVHNFVQTNTNRLQTVTGMKIFGSDLQVDGFCDSNVINGVSMKVLNETILRNSGDQVIRGRMHVNKIQAKNILSKSTKLNEHDINEYVYIDEKSPEIKSNVTLLGRLTITNSIKAQNLITSNKVCGYQLHDMIKDTPQFGDEIHVTGGKSFTGDVTIENLIMKGTLFGHNLTEIRDDISKVSGRIVFNQTTVFKNKKIKTKQLVFKKMLNSMPARDFGRSWLMYETDQVFTAPQYIHQLHSTNRFSVAGLINSHNFTECFENSLFGDRAENVGHVVFHGGINAKGPIEVNGLCGGLHIEDSLLSFSRVVQEVYGGFAPQGQLNVSGNIFVENSINGLKIKNLISFMRPLTDVDVTEGLSIHGDCSLVEEPQIQALNFVNLQERYKTVWLLNEDLVIGNHFYFENAEILEPIDFSGLVNDVNLIDLNANYFSLTRPQAVTSIITIHGSAISNSIFVANSVTLGGKIRDITGKNGIDIKHFDQYVFKSNLNQVITGEWTIDQVFIGGDLNDIIINGLKFDKDILRHDVPRVSITAPKTFRNLIVGNLNCEQCYVQECDLNDWIRRSVFQIGDNRVSGTISVISAEIENIFTNGTINGITFDRNAILLRSTDQVVEGRGEVLSNLDTRQGIRIENLNVESINEIPVDFMENIATYRDNNLRIESKLTFIQPVIIENLKCGGEVFGINVSSMIESDAKIEEDFSRLNNALDFYYTLGERVAHGLHAYAFYLDCLILRQVIPGPVLKAVTFKLFHPNLENPHEKEVLALLIYKTQQSPEIVRFYEYDTSYKNYKLDSYNHPIGSSDPHQQLINIDRISFDGKDHLLIETFDHEKKLIHQECRDGISDKGLRILNDLVGKTTRRIVSMKMSNRDCFVMHSASSRDVGVYCQSSITGNLEHVQEIESDPVIQAISLIDEYYSSLVMLTTAGQVQVWIEMVSGNLALNRTIILHNPTGITVTTYQYFNYIAVCTAPMNNSIHHGSIEIYRSPENSNYYVFQSILIKLPKQIEFSVLPSGELVLYILTENPIHPFLVYQYAGVEGFKEIVVSTTVLKGDHFTVLKDVYLRKEFIVINSNGNAIIVEAVLR